MIFKLYLIFVITERREQERKDRESTTPKQESEVEEITTSKPTTTGNYSAG